MKQRLAAFPQRWFAWFDRIDFLIRRAVIAYWLAPARHRSLPSTAPKPLCPALLLHPLV